MGSHVDIWIFLNLMRMRFVADLNTAEVKLIKF